MYTYDGRVRYSEVGADGHLSLCAAIQYMQDGSIFQSESLGVGIEALKKRNRAWVISSWQIEFVRRPKLGDAITVCTWPSGFKAMYGYRNFMILDADGEVLVRAHTIWVYVNTLTKKPERVDEEVISCYPIEPPLAMEEMGRKIKVTEDFTGHTPYSVRHYHIDTNGHVNNSYYIQMAQEWLPSETDIKKLRVEYKKAAVYGDRIIPAHGMIDGHPTVVLKSPEEQVYAVIQAIE